MLNSQSESPAQPRELAPTSGRIDGPFVPVQGPIRVEPGVVHVFRFHLSGEDELAPLLDEVEGGRARRFMFDQHRRRFTVAHGAKRQILSHVLGAEPASLQFGAGPWGKPFLRDPGPAAFGFNLSHSGDWALLAIGPVGTLGVDLEHQRPLSDMDGVARVSFSPRELSRWRGLAPHHRDVGFFNAWTRKEAYIKAIGQGLHCPLDSFDVSLHPDDPPRLLQIDGQPRLATGWSLYSFEVVPSYPGALVVPAGRWKVNLWAWRDAPA